MIICEGAFDQIVVLKMLRDLLRVMVYAPPTQKVKLTRHLGKQFSSSDQRPLR